MAMSNTISKGIMAIVGLILIVQVEAPVVAQLLGVSLIYAAFGLKE